MAALEIPEAWDAATEEILEAGLRRLLLLGAADVGKSSFCRLLIERLLAAGRDVAVVDADIGQKDLGPPAAVTLGYPKLGGALSDTTPVGFFFVGATSPIGRLLPLALGTAMFARDAEAASTIVNTTGMIDCNGRVLKGYKIEAVRPDAIVAIERSGELAPILAAHWHIHTIRLTPSPLAQPRGRMQRRAARERAFARYFGPAQRLEFGLEELVIQRTSLFTGTPLKVGDTTYAELTAEGPVVVLGGAQANLRTAKVLPAGFERNLLCGLADDTGRGLGLAILERLDFERQTAELFTPVTRERIRVLQFGDLYVAPEGRELGRAPRELF
jgi:polynucleotide 5'-hydroxyl-kinase GRC3/NOL9